jgi:transposase-like protein
MVDELLAVRGIAVSHGTVRQWALEFGQSFANQIRRTLPVAGDKWHMHEVMLAIASMKHWLWHAVTKQRWYSTSWCRAGATRTPPSACCASCSGGNAAHLVS